MGRQYEKDGLIRKLRYELTGFRKQEIVRYEVNLLSDKQVYRIQPYRVGQWSRSDRLVGAARFFQVMSKLDLKKIKPQGEYAWYVIQSFGGNSRYAVENTRKFLVDGERITELNNKQLPIEGYYISSYGMVRVRGTSYESRGVQDYFFDATINLSEPNLKTGGTTGEVGDKSTKN